MEQGAERIFGYTAAEALREQAEVIETVNRLGQTLAAELDLHKLLQAVTDAATEITGARFGSFFYNVLNEEGASYMLYTLSGVPAEAFAHFPMPRATDLFGPTFRGEGTILIDDVRADPRYGKTSPYYGMPEGHLPVTSYLAVPIVSRTGEVLGGLFFGHPDAGVFTGRAARIVEGLAAQAAVAMDNAKLYEAAQRARADGRSANDEAAALKTRAAASLISQGTRPTGVRRFYAFYPAGQLLLKSLSRELDGKGTSVRHKEREPQKAVRWSQPRQHPVRARSSPDGHSTAVL